MLWQVSCRFVVLGFVTAPTKDAALQIAAKRWVSEWNASRRYFTVRICEE